MNAQKEELSAFEKAGQEGTDPRCIPIKLTEPAPIGRDIMRCAGISGWHPQDAFQPRPHSLSWRCKHGVGKNHQLAGGAHPRVAA